MEKQGNAFRDYGDALRKGIFQAMEDAGDEITLGMAQNLMAAGHVDTGALLDSIHSETVDEGDKIVTYVYANAKAQDGVTQYAEFIEHGTGAAHGREGGRVGYWRYKDRNGQWHTTDGMDADPFIEPAVRDVLPEIDSIIEDVIYDIDKYGRQRS